MGIGGDILRPKWRFKGGLGNVHYGVRSSSRLSRCSNVEFDSDIVKCNNRLRVEQNDIEYVRLWGLGTQLGLKCSEDEEVVIRELEGLEVRDNEVRKLFEEGAINGDL